MDEHDGDFSPVPCLIHITGAVKDASIVAMGTEIGPDDVSIAREVVRHQDGTCLLGDDVEQRKELCAVNNRVLSSVIGGERLRRGREHGHVQMDAELI